MSESELDIQLLRKASRKFGDVGSEFASFAFLLDEDPLYLREGDFGYTGEGEGSKLPATYDRIRQEVREYLINGAQTIDELSSAVRLVADRTEMTESENAETARKFVPGEYW